MRHYELVTILSPMLNQDEASTAWDEIKTFISNRDGEITAEQVWGTRRLAYPIRKGNYNFLEGAYYLSSFTVDNPINRELENYLRLDERVLRSLVVRCEGPLADRPAPGPLTAPSRYIPPGRGRRPDGGGPIPEAAGQASERRSGGPAPDTPAAPPAPSEPPPAAPAPSDPPPASTAPSDPPPAATVPSDPPPADTVPSEPPPAATAPQPVPGLPTAPDPGPSADVPAAEPPTQSEPGAEA